MIILIITIHFLICNLLFILIRDLRLKYIIFFIMQVDRYICLRRIQFYFMFLL